MATCRSEALGHAALSWVDSLRHPLRAQRLTLRSARHIFTDYGPAVRRSVDFSLDKISQRARMPGRYANNPDVHNEPPNAQLSYVAYLYQWITNLVTLPKDKAQLRYGCFLGGFTRIATQLRALSDLMLHQCFQRPI